MPKSKNASDELFKGEWVCEVREEDTVVHKIDSQSIQMKNVQPNGKYPALYGTVATALGSVSFTHNFEVHRVRNLGYQRVFHNAIEKCEGKLDHPSLTAPFQDESEPLQRQLLLTNLKTHKSLVAHNRRSGVNILRVWHGTSHSKAKSILALGFAVVAQMEGRYGSGIYFSTNPFYALEKCKHKEEPCLIMCHIITINPFPIVWDDAKSPTELRFLGKPCYKNYDLHYAPVVRYGEKDYRPPEDGIATDFDEIVVFQMSQILVHSLVPLQVKNLKSKHRQSLNAQTLQSMQSSHRLSITSSPAFASSPASLPSSSASSSSSSPPTTSAAAVTPSPKLKGRAQTNVDLLPILSLNSLQHVTMQNIIEFAAGQEPFGLLQRMGELYYCTPSRIKKMKKDGTLIDVIGSKERGYKDGEASVARFSGIRSFTFDDEDNLFVCDSANHCIRKVTSLGLVSTFAGTNESGYKEGKGAEARFHFPYGIAFSSTTEMFYVVDSWNHCVRAIDLEGNVTTLAGGERGSKNGTGNSAQFLNPSAICVNGGGIFVGDGNNCVRKVSYKGEVTTIAGSGTGHEDGPVHRATFSDSIASLSVDLSGNLYVADTDNHTVRIITEGQVHTVAGKAKHHGSKTGLLNKPCGICLAEDEKTLFVADTGNARIMAVMPKSSAGGNGCTLL